jgi:hypothetical protein
MLEGGNVMNPCGYVLYYAFIEILILNATTAMV